MGCQRCGRHGGCMHGCSKAPAHIAIAHKPASCASPHARWPPSSPQGAFQYAADLAIMRQDRQLELTEAGWEVQVGAELGSGQRASAAGVRCVPRVRACCVPDVRLALACTMTATRPGAMPQGPGTAAARFTLLVPAVVPTPSHHIAPTRPCPPPSRRRTAAATAWCARSCTCRRCWRGPSTPPSRTSPTRQAGGGVGLRGWGCKRARLRWCAMQLEAAVQPRLLT